MQTVAHAEGPARYRCAPAPRDLSERLRPLPVSPAVACPAWTGFGGSTRCPVVFGRGGGLWCRDGVVGGVGSWRRLVVS